MKVKIKQFRNKAKEPVASLTPEHAIYDKNGVRLDAKLGNINLQEFRDLQQQGVNTIKKQETQSLQAVAAREAEILAKSDASNISSTAVDLEGNNVEEKLTDAGGKIIELEKTKNGIIKVFQRRYRIQSDGTSDGTKWFLNDFAINIVLYKNGESAHVIIVNSLAELSEVISIPIVDSEIALDNNYGLFVNLEEYKIEYLSIISRNFTNRIFICGLLGGIYVENASNLSLVNQKGIISLKNDVAILNEKIESTKEAISDITSIKDIWSEISDVKSGYINSSGTEESGYFHIESKVKTGEKYVLKCDTGSNIRAYVIKNSAGMVTRAYEQESWETKHDYDVEVTIEEDENGGVIYINSIYDSLSAKVLSSKTAVNPDSISDSSIGVEKLKGRIYNLFNINTITPNSFIDVNTGNVVPNEGMKRASSDYIPVEIGQSYTMPVYQNAMFGNVDKIAMYDKDKAYIGNVKGTLNGVLLTITITNINAAYIRTTIMGGSRYKDPWLRDQDLMMVVNSTTYPNRYYPYGEIITYHGELSPDMNAMYNPLFGKTVVFDGDSICNAGEADQERGWAYRIGMKNRMLWKNYGIGGGTFTKIDGKHVISETDFSEVGSPDYIIFDGGTNDADNCGSILNGNTPAMFGSYSESGYTETFDNTTFCGAVEAQFKRLVTTYPNAKIGVIIAHKMSHIIKETHEIYDDTNQDFTKENNNRRAYFEVLMKLCKKWGIPYINLWDECKLNPWLHYEYGNENSLYFDGQHLTPKGYEIVTSIIEKWMKTL